MAAVTICSDSGAPQKNISYYVALIIFQEWFQAI